MEARANLDVAARKQISCRVFVRKAALRPVPAFAVVDDHIVEGVEATLDDEEDALQDALDRGYADLDRRQAALSSWMARELSGTQDEMVQSLGYFLVVTVYLAFREAFPTRLHEVGDDDLRMADATLEADEEIRAADPTEILDSDDVVALSQPALIAFVQHHVHEALDQSEGEVNLDQLDRIYRALLVQIIALSHAVASPSGEVGPSRDAVH